MNLLRIPAADQIRAIQARGATPRELGWLITVAAPSLLGPIRQTMSFPSRLSGLRQWTSSNLEGGEEILPWLYRLSSVPEAALRLEPDLPGRLALMPDWLAPHLAHPERIAFGPGMIPEPAVLGRWLSDYPLDLELQGPLPTLALPGALRIRGRLSLTAVDGLRRLKVQQFIYDTSELILDRCPDLRSLTGCPGLRRLFIRDCPSLERLALHSTTLEVIDLQGCPSLRTLDLPVSRMTLNRPDLRVRDCRNLEAIGPSLRKDFILRELTILDCPNLRRLPCSLKVRRKSRVEGCPRLVWPVPEGDGEGPPEGT